ncbi:hypothetical protein QBC46DRAFT_449161 [Diplogelasinospora grovesii]|uniref:Uncharacterized protein n=1 Tax=Diplogelasinospora grovesii TaxID=303347 RepID=A0AAN6N7X6_9PEZI|nr:hypothetical protein QBC46DRAFT_449161 [Diplogelasinospora grovesii]
MDSTDADLTMITEDLPCDMEEGFSRSMSFLPGDEFRALCVAFRAEIDAKRFDEGVSKDVPRLFSGESCKGVGGKGLINGPDTDSRLDNSKLSSLCRKDIPVPYGLLHPNWPRSQAGLLASGGAEGDGRVSEEFDPDYRALPRTSLFPQVSHLRVLRRVLPAVVGGLILLTQASPVAAVDLPLRDVFRIGCGVTSAGTATVLAVVRNAGNVEVWVPTVLYTAWGVFFVLYAIVRYFNVRGINNGPVINGPERRTNCETLYSVSVIIFVMNTINALSSGTSTLLDAITIYGPLVLTAAVYVMSYCIIDLEMPGTELVTIILGGGWQR